MVKRVLPILVAVLSACARYEYVSPDCSVPVVLSPPSRIEWRYVGAGGQLTGQVVNAYTRQPVRDAQARLTASEFHGVDSLGRVRLTRLGRGGDTLFVRAINHAVAVNALTLRADTGIEFLALMSPRVGNVTDGCGYVLIQRRKPWWKIW